MDFTFQEKIQNWNTNRDLEDGEIDFDLKPTEKTEDGIDDFGEEALPVKETEIPDWSDEDNIE